MHLMHHGIKGQKWGVRRYQNPDGTLTEEGKLRKRDGVQTHFIEEGGTLKKGITLYRVGAEKGDPTSLNRKYFSTNKADHRRWQNTLYDQNMDYGSVSDLRYKTTKDIKIASNTQVGKEFISMINALDEPTWQNVAYKDIKTAINHYPIKVGSNATNESYWGNVGTATIAAQTKTGQMFVEKMLSSGYGGAGDVNGTDVSRDPVVIFNPDDSTKMTSEKLYTSRKQQGFKRHSATFW